MLFSFKGCSFIIFSRFLNLTVKVHLVFMEHLPVKVFNFNSQGSCPEKTKDKKEFRE